MKLSSIYILEYTFLESIINKYVFWLKYKLIYQLKKMIKINMNKHKKNEINFINFKTPKQLKLSNSIYNVSII